VQACAPRGLSCTSSTSKRLRSFASRLSRAWHRGPHLAGVLAKQQRFEESFECYARAAELYGEVEVSPAGILWLAGVRASMGLVQERMGAMEPALLQYQQALELYEKHLGSWHARVGGVLVAMAGGCQRLGRRSEALRLYLRALAVFSGPSARWGPNILCWRTCTTISARSSRRRRTARRTSRPSIGTTRSC
jgi:tetratricopeptide (TPR) repeat protein